ncbi:hypothetical protein EON81_15335, partial [bacterium]
MRLGFTVWLLALSAAASAQTDVRGLLREGEVRRVRVLESDRDRFTPLVVAALKDNDPDIRRRAAIALREMDPVNSRGRATDDTIGKGLRAATIAALTVASRDDEPTVRDESIRSLIHVLRVRGFGQHGEPREDPKRLAPLIGLGEAALPALIAVLQPSGDRD